MSKEVELLKQLVEYVKEVYNISITANYMSEQRIDLVRMLGLQEKLRDSNLFFIYKDGNYEIEGSKEDLYKCCELFADKIIKNFFDREGYTHDYSLNVARNLYSLIGNDPKKVDEKLKYLIDRDSMVVKLLEQGRLEDATNIYYHELGKIIGSKPMSLLEKCFKTALKNDDYDVAKRIAEMLRYRNSKLMKKLKKKRKKKFTS